VGAWPSGETVALGSEGSRSRWGQSRRERATAVESPAGVLVERLPAALRLVCPRGLAVLGGWGGPLRAALANLYVGCALLATGGLYLDALGLPSRRSTLEGHL
jgi:hypothetical protein